MKANGVAQEFAVEGLQVNPDFGNFVVAGCGLVGVLAWMGGLLLLEAFAQWGTRLDLELGEGGLDEWTGCLAEIRLINEGGVLGVCEFDEF